MISRMDSASGFHIGWIFRVCVLMWMIMGAQMLYGQEESEEDYRPIRKSELTKLAERPPLHLDTTRLYNIGWYYIQIGAVANAIPRAVLLTTDDYWSDNWTERSDFALSVFGFSYPLATAVIYNRIFRYRIVTPADANMFTINSAIGFQHGSLMSDLFLKPVPMTDNIKGRGFMMAGVSLIEGWASMMVSRRRDYTYSQSMAWTTGNFWGSVLGSEIGFLAPIEGTREERTKSNAIGGLVGSGAGIFLAHLLHKNYPRTTGDYRAINSAMFGVQLYTSGVFPQPDIFFNPNRFTQEVRLRGFALKAVQLTGMSAAYYLTRRSELTGGEGFIISGFALSGGLIGWLRYGALENTRNQPGEPSFELSTGVGTIMGWAIGFGVVKLLRQPKYISRPGTSWVPDFRVQPSGLAFMKLSQDQQASLLQSNFQQPLVQMSWRF